MCGYYLIRGRLLSAGKGSPPRVRVLRTYLYLDDRKVRITPACAGTTPILVLIKVVNRDHPRVCGYYQSSY